MKKAPKGPSALIRKQILAETLDPGAERAELCLERLVAAVEVIDAIDDRFAVGDQAGDHQSRRGAQVGRHDGRALQALDAAHDRAIALDRDVGAKALQLERMHEAVL